VSFFFLQFPFFWLVEEGLWKIGVSFRDAISLQVVRFLSFGTLFSGVSPFLDIKVGTSIPPFSCPFFFGNGQTLPSEKVFLFLFFVGRFHLLPPPPVCVVEGVCIFTDAPLHFPGVTVLFFFLVFYFVLCLGGAGRDLVTSVTPETPPLFTRLKIPVAVGEGVKN